MSRHPESNPHFLPRRNNDPVIEFSSQTPPPRSRPPPLHHHGHTSVESPYGPHSPHPSNHPQPNLKPLPPHIKTQHEAHQESRPHSASEPDSQPPSGRSHQHHQRHRHSPFHGPSSQRTRPIAWLLAAFCALFWVIIIVGGIVILIVYLVFRPRSPRFDISTVTMNAAYLDMGYLLNADVTVLANFSNPNTKVNVDFSYVVLDLYYEKNVIATRYVEPFSVAKSESRFADVHMVASQVRLSMAQSAELQRRIESGRIEFDIRGLFRTKSKLGGVFHYSYWLYAHCRIAITAPPTGVLIGKKCVTKR